MSSTEEPDHPAPYSAAVLAHLELIVAEEVERQGRRLRVLDPFGGVGRIHLLGEHADTFSTEIQHRWARTVPGRSLTANARHLPIAARSIDLIVTSPCYGNRMADTYDGSGDRCTACRGTGALSAEEYVETAGARGAACEACGGSGFAVSKRYTYTIAHGSKLHPDNAAAGMHWGTGKRGDRYRELHRAVWRECYRVLRPGDLGPEGDGPRERGGLFVLNVSNFYRGVGPKHARRQELQLVTEWHLEAMLRLGLVLQEVRRVETPRMGNGANRDARAEAESILVFRRPDLPPTQPQGVLDV